jgi:putative endonuclease
MVKKFNLETGTLGEKTAEDFLKREGYKIVLRNFKTKYSEIDLIVKKDNFLVFVEVRTRIGDNFGLPEETINKEKKQRLKRGAVAFISFNSWKGPFRIDAICIVLDNTHKVVQFNHYKNIIE